MLALLLGACASTRPAPPPNVLIGASGHSSGSVLAVNPASTLVASGGLEGTVRIWRLRDGEAIGSWQAHSGTVNGLAFSSDGNELLTAGYDGTLALWSLGGNMHLRVDQLPPITAFDVGRAGEIAITGHADGSLRWWEPSTLRLLRGFTVHRSAVRAVALGPDVVASSADDREVILTDPRGGTRGLPEPPTYARSLAFAPDGSSLYGAGWFKLYRWDPDGAGLQILPTDHWGVIKHIRFTPDGRQLASISRQTDSAVLLIDPETGRSSKFLGKHDLCGRYVITSPDGRYLVTTGDDASIRIWDLQDPLLPR
jgi:WD40 repeat protein